MKRAAIEDMRVISRPLPPTVESFHRYHYLKLHNRINGQMLAVKFHSLLINVPSFHPAATII